MKLKEKLNLGNTEKSAIRSVLIKPVSMILGLVYTPLLLGYLGVEKYGVWATILSIINWIYYSDIGIGNGLRNVLTALLTEKSYERAKKAVSTAYICLTIIAGFIIIVLCILAYVINWNDVLNSLVKVKIPLLISFVSIGVNFILALCNTLLYSLQKAEVVSFQFVAIQAVNVVGLLILRCFSSGNLILVSVLFGCSSMLVYITTSYHIFSNHDYLKPDFKIFDISQLKEINQLGIKFFISQIAFVVLYTTDNLLVSRYFGAVQVTPFSLADKLFNVGYSVFFAFLVPYWSKTTQEVSRKNFSGIRRYFRNLNLLALFFCCGCIIVALVFRPVMNVWLGKNLEVSNGLISTMCLYYCIYSFCGVSSPIINGLGAVNGVMVLGIIQGLLNIPLSIYLATSGGFGIVGIRLATLILVAFGAIFQLFYFNYTLNRLEKYSN